MTTLLIIIAILVVLFFMKQRECFAVMCDDCSSYIKDKNRCSALPMEWKKNGGCPDDLSAKLAGSKTWINQCAMMSKPCFDKDDKNPKKVELRNLYLQVEKLRDAYNSLGIKAANMPEGPAKNKIIETMNKLGKRADELYAKAEGIAKTM
jgi:hypothetical protein